MNQIYEGLNQLGFHLKYDGPTRNDRVNISEMFVLVDLKTQKPIRSVNNDIKEQLAKMNITYDSYRDLYRISKFNANMIELFNGQGNF